MKGTISTYNETFSDSANIYLMTYDFDGGMLHDEYVEAFTPSAGIGFADRDYLMYSYSVRRDGGLWLTENTNHCPRPQ